MLVRFLLGMTAVVAVGTAFAVCFLLVETRWRMRRGLPVAGPEYESSLAALISSLLFWAVLYALILAFTRYALPVDAKPGMTGAGKLGGMLVALVLGRWVRAVWQAKGFTGHWHYVALWMIAFVGMAAGWVLSAWLLGGPFAASDLGDALMLTGIPVLWIWTADHRRSRVAQERA